jgi:hypothetical protein
MKHIFLLGAAIGALVVAGCQPPTITTQPTSQTHCEGEVATFTVAATGNPTPNYQWQKYINSSWVSLPDSGTFSGVYQATLYIGSITVENAGSYRVELSNSQGTIDSDTVTLTVNKPPAITGQPASQTLCQGASASFHVVASGSTPLAYQWRQDGTDLADSPGKISGATGHTLTIHNVQIADAAAYSVEVDNICGNATSLNATLTVPTCTPPVITTQPVSQTAGPGLPLPSFTVAVTGPGPMVYHWRKNCVNLSNGNHISGANSPVLTFSSVSPANAGSYDVLVANPAGSVASSAATLTYSNPGDTTPPAIQLLEPVSAVPTN